jgi:Ca-activated chloride channel family protein
MTLQTRHPVVIALVLLLIGLQGVPSLADRDEPPAERGPGGESSTPPPGVGDLQSGGVAPSELDDETLNYLLGLHRQEEENVRMVLLPVSVTTKKGRPIRGLDAADFLVYEDWVPQEIEFFSAETTDAINVAFLLDVSGSMRQVGKLEAAKEAIRHFVETLRPADRFALICFADQQVAWVTEFTSDRERFLPRLEVQDGYGKTAINDAVGATPELVDARIKGKKAIVLITDGVDNASKISPWRAVRLARNVNVPIYTIGFSSLPRSILVKGETPPNLAVLSTFTRETGGMLFAVNDPDDMKEAASTIVDELRFQYLIGYYPTRTVWDGSFRRVRLESRKGQVRTRNGYYATP